MALLQLQDIGKIYVSEGSVAVGIRGVNLSFDSGEFVAITGMSGSGKSTLLNVISGMDSYEEGELYIEGQATSHYLQPDWEAYREKYISFIFQDYNIIESFTVLQNVELALMHIQDKRERRARAVELLKRVGLGDRMRQKGSKLSGGQKQRTVIARALAKDSPIILADEPTGNLDSKTSTEIIELLREVSKDKLLIMVTHNFEQVEAYATRHVRVYDGAIESDHVISKPQVSENVKKEQEPESKTRRTIRNGIMLGRTMFLAKPKLSVFLCLLMLVGTLGVYVATATSGDAKQLFEPYHMFEHLEGRVIITSRNGDVISSSELQSLADKYGAEDYLRVDMLFDEYDSDFVLEYYNEATWEYFEMRPTYNKDYGDDIIGRYPEKVNEVFLYLPITLQPYFGKDEIENTSFVINNIDFTISGIQYYIDNNLDAEILFTEEGFDLYTAMYFLSASGQMQPNIVVQKSESEEYSLGQLRGIYPAFNLEPGTVAFSSAEYDDYIKYGAGDKAFLRLHGSYEKYDYFAYGNEKYTRYEFNYDIPSEQFSTATPDFSSEYVQSTHMGSADYVLAASPDVICDIVFDVLEKSYCQASLFFADDDAAEEAAAKLRDAGYIAVPSNTEYKPDVFEMLASLIAGILAVFVWFMMIVFLAFFINLCSSRTVGAFKGEMAIMRSMGIQVNVIRIALYVRMLCALIPAFIIVVVGSNIFYRSPKLNNIFMYIYPWQYAVIFLGVVILTIRVTKKQIKNLFGESVKKSLKGGTEE